MDSIGVLNIFKGNLIILIFSAFFSLLMGEKDVPSDSIQYVLCIKYILTAGCVSSHLCELKALSCISQVQSLAQKAMAAGIPNSEFLLETHRFIKK